MPCRNMPKKRYEVEAGIRMRELRKERGLTLRDVEEASVHIAKVRKNKRSVIRPSQLSLIEHGRIPNIHRIGTLSRIYRVSLKSLLTLYRVWPAKSSRTAFAAILRNVFEKA